MDNSTAGDAADLASHAGRGFVEGAFGAIGSLFSGILAVIVFIAEGIVFVLHNTGRLIANFFPGILTLLACAVAIVIYFYGYAFFLGVAGLACVGTALASIKILHPKLWKSRSPKELTQSPSFAIIPITALVVGVVAAVAHWYNYKYETGATWVYILYEMDLAVFALCGLVFVAIVAIRGIVELYRWASGNQGAMESDEEAAKPAEGKKYVIEDYNEKVVEEVDDGFPPVRDTTF